MRYWSKRVVFFFFFDHLAAERFDPPILERFLLLFVKSRRACIVDGEDRAGDDDERGDTCVFRFSERHARQVATKGERQTDRAG